MRAAVYPDQEVFQQVQGRPGGVERGGAHFGEHGVDDVRVAGSDALGAVLDLGDGLGQADRVRQLAVGDAIASP